MGTLRFDHHTSSDHELLITDHLGCGR